MPTSDEIEQARAAVKAWVDSPDGTEAEERAKFDATAPAAKVLKAAKDAGQL